MAICDGCGGSFDSNFKFCPNCGRAIKEPDSVKIDININEQNWEICEIKYMVVKGSGFFANPKIKFVAEVRGKNGINHVAESPVIDGEGDYGGDFPPFDDGYLIDIAKRTIDMFENTLLKDGWEYLGYYANVYYAKKFRRLTKNVQSWSD